MQNMQSSNLFFLFGTKQCFSAKEIEKQLNVKRYEFVWQITHNAKRNLLKNYHKIKRKYLQLYLNEFVYKLNRRYFGESIFDRLIIANVNGL